MRIAPILVVSMLAAGCSEKPAATGDGGQAFSRLALWSNCKGFKAAIFGPASMYDFPPAPAGWQSDSPTTEFDLRFFTCDRVSWGNFERGPVHMILEMGGSFSNPDSCWGDAADFGQNLGTWWFSDEEVARYAADVYHANAFYAPINVQLNSTGGVVDQTWEWALDGQPKSNARFVDADVPMNTHTMVTRVFWFVNETQVYAMDFQQDWLVAPGHVDGTATHPSSGHLEDPMFFAQTSPQKDFAARSEQYIDMEIGADFYRFDDLQCQRPLPL